MAPIMKTINLSVRVTAELADACETAAERAHLTVADWHRGVLALAANQGAFAPRKGNLPDARKRRSKSTPP